jgi:hypothetical protein
LGDTTSESDETFTVTLSNPAAATIAPTAGTGTATIVDDDISQISINDVSSAEGNSGQSDFTFTVSLSQPSGRTITVNYATTDGTATTANLDYEAASGTLTFNPGDTSKDITVKVNGDTLNEGDETFTVDLSSPANAVIQDNQGLGTITNDDSLPSLSVNNATVDEGNSGTASMTFTVTLSAASGQTISVDYATADGTATVSGNDFASASGTLTFAPGDTTKTVVVLANGDKLTEVNETFTLVLSNAVNGTITPGGGLGTITNDDHNPALTGNPAKSIDEDATLVFSAADFSAAFTDADSDSLAAVKITRLPANGTLKLNTTNVTLNQVIAAASLSNLKYTSGANYNGSDSLGWNASDGFNFAAANAEVQITVNPINDPPTLDAIADVTVDQNSSETTINLTGITSGAANEAQNLIVTAVSSDVSIIPDPTIEYTSPNTTGLLKFAPAPDAIGEATITVTVYDEQAQNGILDRTFKITINGYNRNPVAVADTVEVVQDDSLVIPLADLTANDSDPDHDALTITSVGEVQHGTIGLVDQNITYTPTQYYVGEDTFTYTLVDGKGGTSEGLVTIQVKPAQTSITTGTGGTLNYTSSQGTMIEVSVPGNAVNDGQNVVLKYVAQPSSSSIPSDFTFAGTSFTLEAYVDGVRQPHYQFNRPMTLTVHYTDADFAGLLESSLIVNYWDEELQLWRDVATTCTPVTCAYEYHPDENWLRVSFQHLTEFALFGRTGTKMYLPLISNPTHDYPFSVEGAQ